MGQVQASRRYVPCTLNLRQSFLAAPVMHRVAAIPTLLHHLSISRRTVEIVWSKKLIRVL